MQIIPIRVSPTQLLVDPNNYRFLDIQGYKLVIKKERFSEPGVQQRALQYLNDTDSFDVESLTDSIASNGFVPLEQLVVEQFDDVDGVPRYLVIEGNRRVAAVLSLLEDLEGGAVELAQEVIDSLQELQAIEIQGTDDERKAYKQTLMAIRHIAGIKEWGAYQQAKLVVELYENGQQQFTKVAQRIGISPVEVGRRYRASKALQQMEEDDEFGRYANPKLYVFFHEAMAQPKLRQWFEFNDETFTIENEDAKRGFYELLSPAEVDGETLLPKLDNANKQIRQMKDIVDKPIPLKILLDPERPFEDAVNAADKEAVEDAAGLLESSLGQAFRALKDPGIDAWLDPSEKALEIWNQLVELVDKIRKMLNPE